MAMSRILLARVQHPQDVNVLGADLVYEDVVWVHYVFTRASNTAKPEKVGH